MNAYLDDHFENKNTMAAKKVRNQYETRDLGDTIFDRTNQRYNAAMTPSKRRDAIEIA